MSTAVSFITIALLVAVIGLLLVLLARTRQGSYAGALERLAEGQERADRQLREEMGRGRQEASTNAMQLREEVGSLVGSLGESIVMSVAALGTHQKEHLDTFAKQLQALTETTDARLNELRTMVDSRLRQLQEENSGKLDEMRKTVDERLESTLEKRLGDSFKQVSERLEAVHQGLGEMQALAAGVGDLKKVLSNVKTRGTWGEVQLGNLLEQMLTVDQFEANVCCKLGTAERVEFGIRLPGREGKDGDVIYLPIDAKFPVEDYERLEDAREQGDKAAAELAEKQLEARVRMSARDIQSKYVNPPRTTDFGIMFLPSEALYAEVLRRPGLAQSLQAECRVTIAGPSTLAALLTSLQMGFRSLAVEKRSSEVWQLLGAVKTQFGQFGVTLEKVHRKLDQASNTIEEAARRSRTIERKLRAVEELPADAAVDLLPLGEEQADETPDD